MFSNINIVLLNTSHPGNIGSTARAMKTMGLNNLKLVNPKEFPSDQATARAVGCSDILEQSEIFDNLSSAISSSEVTIGFSARKRKANIPILHIDECIKLMLNEDIHEYNILFGNEKLIARYAETTIIKEELRIELQKFSIDQFKNFWLFSLLSLGLSDNFLKKRLITSSL